MSGWPQPRAAVGGWCLGGLARWEAFAVQNGLPIIGPGLQPAVGGLQLQVLVVAGGEEHVLPAGVLLSPCKARREVGSLQTQTPNESLIKWEETSANQPWTPTTLEAASGQSCHPTPPLPVISGLSSMSRSAETTVLSRVKTICSRNSGPKCFSTQAYWKARGER